LHLHFLSMDVNCGKVSAVSDENSRRRLKDREEFVRNAPRMNRVSSMQIFAAKNVG